MRLFYKYTDEKHIEVVTSADGRSETQIKTPVDDVQALVDSGDAVIYDTQEQLKQVIVYAKNRQNEYPPIQDQLDTLYHEGIDAWKETIQAVKDAHPKPE